MTAVLNETKAKVARELLKSAAGAAQQLESDVHQLVTMRAWEVLSYENFSEMWEKEAGFAPPPHVQVLAVAAMASEGMNTHVGNQALLHGANGHRTVDVARAIGVNHNGIQSNVVSGILRQLREGVPAEKVVRSGHGTRSRQRRTGVRADEFVQEGFNLLKREADAVDEIARQNDVPKSEIYRQAVAEYLARYRESRP